MELRVLFAQQPADCHQTQAVLVDHFPDGSDAINVLLGE